MSGERGQTTQDFAIGVSVLLVTIIGAFVFSQAGGLSVYEDASPGVEQPQADRIASFIVTNYSVENRSNVLRYDNGPDERSIDDLPGGQTKLDGLIEEAGADVDSDRRTDPVVNVSIVDEETLRDGERTPARDNGEVLAWGEYRTTEPARSSRVVNLTNDGDADRECDSTCWLVVRVW